MKKIKENLTDEIYKRLNEKNENISQHINPDDINTVLHELDVFEAELLAQNEELQEKETLLVEAKEEYEHLFSNAPVLYIVIDEKLNIVRHNIMADRYFGFSLLQTQKKSLLSYIPKSIEVFLNFLNKDLDIQESEIIEFYAHNRHTVNKFKVQKDTHRHHQKNYYLLVLTNIQQEYDAFDKIHKLEEEKLQHQEHLMQQSRVAALGEMIGNIAHQWRQPLAVVSSQINLVNLSIELEEEITKENLKECINSVNIQIKHLSNTIDDFRNYFIQKSPSTNEINLKDTLLTNYKLVKSALDNNFIECIQDYDDVIVNYDDNQLIHAFINISNNAKDALKIIDGDKYLFISLTKDDKNAIISFKDNGGGVSEEIIDKIYDPYFTTKHKSSGTGIGLYMTHQIITKLMHGSIEVKNVKYSYNDQAYRGAEFTIKLPLNK